MSVKSEFNMRCPQCKKDDCIEIVVTKWVLLVADGTDDAQDGSQEWENSSPAQCTDCDYSGTVKDFTIVGEDATQ